MQLAVVRAMKNLVVLASVSGHMYHPKVRESDEINKRSMQMFDRSHRASKND